MLLFTDPSSENLAVPSAHLLLVEDSSINQLIIKTMLHKGGHSVDIADCGMAAIKAVSATRYDLIFMDVSMPDMTGMEATRRIRQLGGAEATVPIIAITAHAFEDYNATCLAAGMNGFITKPVGKKDLLALVAQWCGSATPGVSAQSTITVEPVVGSIELLNEKVLQQFTDDYSMVGVPQLLQLSMTELLKRSDKIKCAVDQRDLTALGFEAHTLKSGVALLGAWPLHTLAVDMEASSHDNKMAATLLLAEQLLPCLEATVAALALRINKEIA
ncbi:hybrid sensor histidine kinase/response regulator [Methylobacter sp. S3L5C]|uniref:response regulator n=1 Tax=Methylobacter sp. S3L5C TaxID=2839024 RepID=UPI001FADFB83|nr:response regulator [Methylobacter sp. S3L5C]UOA06840.1 response regulator [Methylobacter sp. S3L5C]